VKATYVGIAIQLNYSCWCFWSQVYAGSDSGIKLMQCERDQLLNDMTSLATQVN